MTYAVEYKDRAKNDLKKLEKSGRKILMEKVFRFVGEVEAHPKTGTGHPKPLSGHKGNIWARKVSDGDRFVYEIVEEERIVLVTQVLGHYNDR